MKRLRSLGAPLLGLFLVSCASGPPLRPSIAPPISAVDPAHGYRFGALKPGPGNTDEVMVVLAISGGGMRAAAMGFGALEALAQIKVTTPSGGDRDLFSEIDVVSGVSGGSYVAGALALDRRAMLETFPERLLYFDFSGAVIARTFTPSGLYSTFSPVRGRTEILERMLDQRLFRGATFGDLQARGLRPFLTISATSMATAGRFEFVQEQFDALCSDLSPVRLSFAAASSSAFPIVFTPTTVVNHAGQCGYTTRAGPDASEADRLANAEQFPFVHLFDGGLSDNLGIRGLQQFAEGDESGAGVHGVKRVIVIIVDAQNRPSADLAQWPLTPNVLQVSRAVGEVTIRRYNGESRRLIREMLHAWQTLAADPNTDHGGVLAPGATFHLIEVGLDQIADPAQRQQLEAQPTSLRLPRETINELRAVARAQVLTSAEWALAPEIEPPVCCAKETNRDATAVPAGP